MGVNEKGLLGQGEGVISSKSFNILEYDLELEFQTISLLNDHVLAITKTGQVYGWGSNLNN